MEVQTGKYSVAWFKLAEFVIRKEKERALAIFRLLAHSLHDEALACQLEGDLLLSFNDEKAIEVYLKAATLYERDQKLREAAALYEHITMLMPHSIDYIYKMLALYRTLAIDIKIVRSLVLLAGALMQHDSEDSFDTFLDELNFPADKIALLYEHIILNFLQKGAYLRAYEYIEKSIDLLEKEETEQAQKFIGKLHILDGTAYNHALAYMAKQSYKVA